MSNSSNTLHHQAYPRKRRRPAHKPPCSCLLAILILVGFISTILAAYFLLPNRTNILVMGIDYSDPGNAVARTDSLVLTTFLPLEPYVGMLSIPRDLWVTIPGIGESRINVAHFYAESQQPGSGPEATLQTVKSNFGVDIDYYVRIRFEGFKEIVNTLGGIDIELTKPIGGYEAGVHHLTGNKALAFVRHRLGSDDFFRMEQGQIMAISIFKSVIKPANWPRLPKIAQAFFRTVDTNIPSWMWLRLSMALLRAGPNHIDNRIISREMVVPFTTAEGAMVLAPNWDLINPVLLEMFDQ